jgi:hypothetical protein
MRLRVLSVLGALLLPLVIFFSGPARAQPDSVPSVRGTLYESPSFGWILLVPQPAWDVASAESEGGEDSVHLVSTLGDGADAFIVATRDDGRGAAGCLDDMLANLASAYEGFPVQGWFEPDVERDEFGADGLIARARIVMSDDPAFDILAFVECKRGADSILIGQSLLRTAQDVENTEIPLLLPLWPGGGHTGQPRASRELRSDEQGVVRFLARGRPAQDPYAFPFWCIDQESFPRPVDAPPPDRGWFACDGQIANIDVMPATIDLEQIALGCLSEPTEDEIPAQCPDEPVVPSHYEVLQGPASAAGSELTLQPGESADVVLWYALPEGDPPLDILYLEPDRTVRVGPTFYSAGSGSRPRVRLGR